MLGLVEMESFLLASPIYLTSLVLVIWIAGAIYYDVGGASAKGAALAVGWVALASSAYVYWQPPWKPFGLLLIFFVLFLRWWFSKQPSQTRNWDAHFARLPSLSLNGDVITIENVRNAEYGDVDDRGPRYETRGYRLSHLRGVDALILNWGVPWMSHPMFVFDFGPDGRVCISIEVRYRVGQRFSFFRSLYRQQELIFVVSDERDAILRRTKYLENHDLYLYRLQLDGLTVRQFFLEYANSINALAKRPRWYHGLTTNCTTSIYAQGRGRMQWDWRMLFNGSLDRLLYERERLDRELPFDRLKEQSWINEIANRAPSDGFGDYLRRELPGYRQDTDSVCRSEQAGGEER
jgi:hypothetical protein